MDNISFFKYQGAGNDFIVIDNRNGLFTQKSNQSLIAQWCDRHFGIGADGMILLENHPDFNFEMIYYNADGALGSMCGNGGRCVVAFAHFLGIGQRAINFLAVDGPHKAIVERPDWISLQMSNVDQVEKGEDFFFLDTGSPHYIKYVNQLDQLDVFQEGRAIRYNDRFAAKGTNVNFIEPNDQGLSIATYERGVENETLACGTGITAAAIAHHLEQKVPSPIHVKAKGGDLSVSFEVEGQKFKNIWLNGPAVQVFQGRLSY